MALAATKAGAKDATTTAASVVAEVTVVVDAVDAADAASALTARSRAHVNGLKPTTGP